MSTASGSGSFLEAARSLRACLAIDAGVPGSLVICVQYTLAICREPCFSKANEAAKDVSGRR
jgi:hypothetical protein